MSNTAETDQDAQSVQHATNSDDEASETTVPASNTRSHVRTDADSQVDEQLAEVQSRTVFVRNLNFATTQEDLAALLRKKVGVDGIVTTTIARDAEKQRSAGYGFVECSDRLGCTFFHMRFNERVMLAHTEMSR